jgi:hypothetical protein
MKKLLVIVVLMVFATLVWAQCPEEYTVLVGTSQCIDVCAGQVVNVNLVGRHFWSIDAFSLCTGCFCLTYASEDNSPQGVPTVVMVAGCINSPSCSEECSPVAPPAALVLGGDPFYPLDYYGESDCLFMYMRFDHYLPVDLTSFTAAAGDGQITLNWTTRAEANMDHFEIVRDGVRAADIQCLNPVSGANYSWTDHLVTNGNAYSYTLAAVDVNNNRGNLQTIDGVTPRAEPLPTAVALYQNYPNPFNAQTSIAFDLVNAGPVTLDVYDMVGRHIVTLVNSSMDAGPHAVSFDAGRLPSGMYLYRLEAPGLVIQKKMLLLK